MEENKLNTTQTHIPSIVIINNTNNKICVEAWEKGFLNIGEGYEVVSQTRTFLEINNTQKIYSCTSFWNIEHWGENIIQIGTVSNKHFHIGGNVLSENDKYEILYDNGVVTLSEK